MSTKGGKVWCEATADTDSGVLQAKYSRMQRVGDPNRYWDDEGKNMFEVEEFFSEERQREASTDTVKGELQELAGITGIENDEGATNLPEDEFGPLTRAHLVERVFLWVQKKSEEHEADRLHNPLPRLPRANKSIDAPAEVVLERGRLHDEFHEVIVPVKSTKRGTADVFREAVRAERNPSSILTKGLDNLTQELDNLTQEFDNLTDGGEAKWVCTFLRDWAAQSLGIHGRTSRSHHKCLGIERHNIIEALVAASPGGADDVTNIKIIVEVEIPMYDGDCGVLDDDDDEQRSSSNTYFIELPRTTLQTGSTGTDRTMVQPEPVIPDFSETPLEVLGIIMQDESGNTTIRQHEKLGDIIKKEATRGHGQIEPVMAALRRLNDAMERGAINPTGAYSCAGNLHGNPAGLVLQLGNDVSGEQLLARPLEVEFDVACPFFGWGAYKTALIYEESIFRSKKALGLAGEHVGEDVLLVSEDDLGTLHLKEASLPHNTGFIPMKLKRRYQGDRKIPLGGRRRQEVEALCRLGAMVKFSAELANMLDAVTGQTLRRKYLRTLDLLTQNRVILHESEVTFYFERSRQGLVRLMKVGAGQGFLRNAVYHGALYLRELGVDCEVEEGIGELVTSDYDLGKSSRVTELNTGDVSRRWAVLDEGEAIEILTVLLHKQLNDLTKPIGEFSCLYSQMGVKWRSTCGQMDSPHDIQRLVKMGLVQQSVAGLRVWAGEDCEKVGGIHSMEGSNLAHVEKSGPFQTLERMPRPNLIVSYGKPEVLRKR